MLTVILSLIAALAVLVLWRSVRFVTVGRAKVSMVSQRWLQEHGGGKWS